MPSHSIKPLKPYVRMPLIKPKAIGEAIDPLKAWLVVTHNFIHTNDGRVEVCLECGGDFLPTQTFLLTKLSVIDEESLIKRAESPKRFFPFDISRWTNQSKKMWSSTRKAVDTERIQAITAIKTKDGNAVSTLGDRRGLGRSILASSLVPDDLHHTAQSRPSVRDQKNE